jgi:hypothetical protein
VVMEIMKVLIVLSKKTLLPTLHWRIWRVPRKRSFNADAAAETPRQRKGEANKRLDILKDGK